MKHVSNLRALVQFLEHEGRYTEAEKMLRKCLSLQEEEGMTDTIPYANDLYAIGMLKLLSDSELARSYLLRALELKRSLQGDDHEEISYILEALALVTFDEPHFLSAS